jgi:chromatin remodeling complex protein RSC6
MIALGVSVGFRILDLVGSSCFIITKGEQQGLEKGSPGGDWTVSRGKKSCSSERNPYFGGVQGAGCSPFTTFSEVHMAKKKKAKKKAVKKKKPAKKKAVKRKVKKKAAKKKVVKRKKKAVKKKVAKKKAKKKKAKRKPNAAFMKPVQPDAKLAEVVGSKPLPRTQLTKKLWAYIKRKGLQDKKNRRMINADAKLKAVFNGKAQVSMFEMTKLVNKHVK